MPVDDANDLDLMNRALLDIWLKLIQNKIWGFDEDTGAGSDFRAADAYAGRGFQKINALFDRGEHAFSGGRVVDADGDVNFKEIFPRLRRPE